eukprot:TRINITY_DN19853_c0_g1_i1.p1 TRINITY_DN19853_c0_g1~~TRINITY_DN19853_c0_g1_i1.p1  ORF type:complete len:234 (+),score=66.46 TRINITY_DN19853_c0_g1_i1:56-757(+)
MASLLPRIKLQIVSDNVCPWCYVGKRRLEKALSQYKDKAEFDITWHPFFLNPDSPVEGVNKMEAYESKFGKARVAQMLPHMQAIGKEDGINFSYGGKTANTLRSHRLVHLATKSGKQDQIINKLFAGYFENEQNPGDVDFLVQAAVDAGLDGPSTRAYIESTEDVDLIKKEAREFSTKWRISGVPFFIFNNKYTLSGAQEPSTFVSVIDRILNDESKKAASAPVDACTKDSCL